MRRTFAILSLHGALPAFVYGAGNHSGGHDAGGMHGGSHDTSRMKHEGHDTKKIHRKMHGAGAGLAIRPRSAARSRS